MPAFPKTLGRSAEIKRRYFTSAQIELCEYSLMYVCVMVTLPSMSNLSSTSNRAIIVHITIETAPSIFMKFSNMQGVYWRQMDLTTIHFQKIYQKNRAKIDLLDTSFKTPFLRLFILECSQFKLPQNRRLSTHYRIVSCG